MGTPVSQHGTFNSQSNEETSDDGKESTSGGASIDRKISGTVYEAVRNATSGLDRTAEERSAAFLLYGVVEVGLATHERAICYAGGVGDGRHKLDILVEDIAGAGLA